MAAPINPAPYTVGQEVTYLSNDNVSSSQGWIRAINNDNPAERLYDIVPNQADVGNANVPVNWVSHLSVELQRRPRRPSLVE